VPQQARAATTQATHSPSCRPQRRYEGGSPAHRRYSRVERMSGSVTGAACIGRCRQPGTRRWPTCPSICQQAKRLPPGETAWLWHGWLVQQRTHRQILTTTPWLTVAAAQLQGGVPRFGGGGGRAAIWRQGLLVGWAVPLSVPPRPPQRRLVEGDGQQQADGGVCSVKRGGHQG
jgi:hypothetical protein